MRMQERKKLLYNLYDLNSGWMERCLVFNIQIHDAIAEIVNAFNAKIYIKMIIWSLSLQNICSLFPSETWCQRSTTTIIQ